MLRPLAKIFGLSFLLLLASVGVVYYQHAASAEKKIEKPAKNAEKKPDAKPKK